MRARSLALLALLLCAPAHAADDTLEQKDSFLKRTGSPPSRG